MRHGAPGHQRLAGLVRAWWLRRMLSFPGAHHALPHSLRLVLCCQVDVRARIWPHGMHASREHAQGIAPGMCRNWRACMGGRVTCLADTWRLHAKGTAGACAGRGGACTAGGATWRPRCHAWGRAAWNGGRMRASSCLRARCLRPPPQSLSCAPATSSGLSHDQGLGALETAWQQALL